MNKEERAKAKELLGRNPTDKDEPFDSIKGWDPEEPKKKGKDK